MVSFRRAGTTSPSKPVNPSASLATSFVSTPGSDGTSPSGFCGAFCVSLGSNDVSCVSSSGSDGASSVSSLGSDSASRVLFLGYDGNFHVSCSGFNDGSRVFS